VKCVIAYFCFHFILCGEISGATLPDASVDPSGDGNGGNVELSEKAKATASDRERRERLRRPVIGDPLYGNTSPAGADGGVSRKNTVEDLWCAGSGDAWANVSLDVPSPAIYSPSKVDIRKMSSMNMSHNDCIYCSLGLLVYSSLEVYFSNTFHLASFPRLSLVVVGPSTDVLVQCRAVAAGSSPLARMRYRRPC